MPVTARLSKLFYERLGEDIANELVELFNTLDASYKADLRELIDAHFARFDAKLAEQSARFDSKLAEMNARVDSKLAEMNARFDSKLAEMNARFDSRFPRTA